MAYAHWFRRVAGFLIDGVIAFIPSLIGGLIYESTVDGNGDPSTVGQIADIVGIVIAVGVLAYNRWFLAGRTGQTWGRRMVGIRLTGEADQQPIGAGRAFVRDLAHLLDSASVAIGWLFPLWDTKRQTFADKIMNTVVLRATA